MGLADKRAQLLAELEPFGDHHERFQYIIDRAKSAPNLEAALKLDAFLIEGCTSNLWLVPSVDQGVCRFRCDADSLITKGIASLVCELYDGASPQEVAATDANFLAEVGITQHLSPNRRNGLTNLVGKIRAFGQAASR
ncbi:MAG: SufE family protein [Verrucomicrobia bacterium]|jgi:cysteine desulfuration protein SufE|nr:SufE family protein [Verrucomicrobiota bacterium]